MITRSDPALSSPESGVQGEVQVSLNRNPVFQPRGILANLLERHAERTRYECDSFGYSATRSPARAWILSAVRPASVKLVRADVVFRSSF